MFDASKRDAAIESVKAMCLNCGEKHSSECPLVKAIATINEIPVK